MIKVHLKQLFINGIYFCPTQRRWMIPSSKLYLISDNLFSFQLKIHSYSKRLPMKNCHRESSPSLMKVIHFESPSITLWILSPSPWQPLASFLSLCFPFLCISCQWNHVACDLSV